MYLNKAFNLAEINVVAKDLAYFAGISDTEVYYGIGEPYTLHLSYNKQNGELLKLLSKSFGGKIHKVKIQPFHSEQVWVWNLSSNHAYKVLRKIHPFLRIKRERARLCIECYERCVQPELSLGEKRKIGEAYRERLQNCQTEPEQRFDYFGLPHLKIAYIAGLFDVDSSFVITERKDRNSYLLEVFNRKTDYETLEFINKTFGGKIYSVPKSKLNKQDIWELKYNSQQAYVVLQQVYPHLKAQKRVAELCMQFQEGYWRGITGIPVSPERQAIGAKYANLLRLYHLKWRSRRGVSKHR
ncbi:MAG TPA: hypothetical protein G4N93_02485 [Dehalococcoidia bacterium]|nr:hypothetical protein [Dehalococcoidia bacterium]